MKVLVEFTNKERTRATITIVPGWLGRLFGRAQRAGEAERRDGSYSNGPWVWRSTGRDVDADFSGYPVRTAFETQPVEPLPVALGRHAP